MDQEGELFSLMLFWIDGTHYTNCGVFKKKKYWIISLSEPIIKKTFNQTKTGKANCTY